MRRLYHLVCADPASPGATCRVRPLFCANLAALLWLACFRTAPAVQGSDHPQPQHRTLHGSEVHASPPAILEASAGQGIDEVNGMTEFGFTSSSEDGHVSKPVTWRSPQPLFVTYHKTGTVLARQALAHCLANFSIDLHLHGEFPDGPSSFVVHFVRDPAAIIRSAYLYHLEASEQWLLENDRHSHFLASDAQCFQNYVDGENYQEYLNRVPEEIGIRAELIRSSTEIMNMTRNAFTCIADTVGCKQVCLESFAASSQSFNESWAGILAFLGLDASLLDCISTVDLLSPTYAGHEQDHATHSSQHMSGDFTKLFERFDSELFNGYFGQASSLLKCDLPAQRLLRSRSKRSAVSTGDPSHIRVAESYA